MRDEVKPDSPWYLQKIAPLTFFFFVLCVPNIKRILFHIFCSTDFHGRGSLYKSKPPNRPLRF